MARRYINCNTRNKRTTDTKIGISPNKTGERRLQNQQKEIEILPERNSMARTYHFTRWSQTKQRRNGRNQQKNPPTNTKSLKLFLGAIQYFANYIPNLSEKTDNMRQLMKKMKKMAMDRKTKRRFQQFEKRINDTPVSSILEQQQRKYRLKRRVKQRTRNSATTTTKQRRVQNDRFLCKPLPKRCRKEIFRRRTGITGRSLGT